MLSLFFSSPAGCRAPLSPVNGSIEEYSSTEEGAEIQFHCHDGYTPNKMMSSQCLNQSWTPDPMELVCIMPDIPSEILLSLSHICDEWLVLITVHLETVLQSHVTSLV